MLPDTDFAPILKIRSGKVEINRDVIVPIFCGKTGRNRPAHLFENCAIADPRPTFVRHRKIGGDRAKKFNPVARAFLVAVYPTWPQSQWDELCALMERAPDVIKLMANRFGVIRETTADEMKVRMVRANEAMQSSGRRMNAAQMDYILTRHRSGDWPIVGGCNKGAFYEKRVALKAEIVAGVAALGAPTEPAATPTVAPVIVSEARAWNADANDESLPQIECETDLLRIRNLRERDAALNKKLRVFERGIGPCNARREREVEYKRLQMMDMNALEELGSRQALDRWQKQRLTTYKNKFAADSP